jgi:hypothetical protein
MHAGTTRSTPPDPLALTRIAGYGSSPLVAYEGEGVYFLDRIRPGLWRLEVYPDAVPVRDPFERPHPEKIVTLAISRSSPMTLTLPDLGAGFTVQPVTGGNPCGNEAAAGRFSVTPGVYLLSASGLVDAATLPAYVGAVGLAEYHAPPPDTLPLVVTPLAASAYPSNSDAEFRARIVDQTPPDSANLFVRLIAGDWFHRYPLQPAGGYEYAATVPAAELREGPHEFVITVYRDGIATTYPDGQRHQPWDWNYTGRNAWKVTVVPPNAPLRLFDPATDLRRLAFTRIGDAGRNGRFQVRLSSATGRPTFRFPLPRDRNGWSPPDYAASLVVAERVRARKETIAGAEAVRLRLRGLGVSQTLHVTLMEDDGTSWVAALRVDSTRSEALLPLASFTIGRGVLVPQGFPGEWNYWVGAAAGRGGAGDRPRLERLERLQLSLRMADAGTTVPDEYGVEVEWVTLERSGP